MQFELANSMGKRSNHLLHAEEEKRNAEGTETI